MALAWKTLPIYCEVLRWSCHLLQSKSTVESDFYILIWEKDPFRKYLSNSALMGVVQTNQWESLEFNVELEYHAPKLVVE